MISTDVFIPLVLLGISTALIGISSLSIYRQVKATRADIERLCRNLIGDGR